MDIFDSLDQPQAQSTQQQPYQQVNFEGISQGKPTEDIFNSIEQQPVQLPEKENISKKIPRLAGQGALRAVEAFGGLKGNVEEGVTNLAASGLEKIGMQKSAEHIRGLRKQPANIAGRSPTSQELRDIGREATNDYFEPQTTGEEKGGEFIERLTNLLTPIGRSQSILRNVGVAGAGMMAKEGIKAAGGSPNAQTAGDIGLSLLAGSINPGMTARASAAAYNQASRILPNNATAPFVAGERSLRRLRARLARGAGHTDPDKQAVMTEIDEMLNLTNNGRIPVRDLEAFHQKFNKMTIDRNLYGARNNLRYLNALTMQSARHYGRQNPQWYEAWNRGNQLHSGVAVGRKIAQKIENTMNKHPLNAGAGGVATLALFGVNPAIIIPSLKGAAASYVLGHAGALSYQVLRNPELRRLYLGALRTAASGNAANLGNKLKELSNKIPQEIDLSEFMPQ